MAVVSDSAFKNVINKFNMNPNYYYDDTVDNLLGTGRWSSSDVEGTIKRFNDAGYSAKSYHNVVDKGTKYEGRLWIKIVKGTVISVETEIQPELNSSSITRYFKNHIYYAYKYSGDISALPQWITDNYECNITGKPDGEFRLVTGNDNWELVQADDVIVFDTVKNKFIIYDSEIEFNKLFISDLSISESLVKTE